MKYTIELNCRAQSFRYNIVNTNLYRKLISCRDNGGDIEEFWEKYLEKTEWSCECDQPNPKWIGDRFWLTVKDESDNVVYETENQEDIPIRMVNKQKFVVSKAMLLARISWWKGYYAGFSFETDSFDVKKLYFENCQYNNDPYSSDLRFIENIRYEGADVELEDDAWLDEQYAETYITLFNEKMDSVEDIPINLLEKFTTYIVKE